MTALGDLRARVVSRVALLVLAGGAGGALLGQTIGYRCPWRSIGLACPGCGCVRAVVGFLSEGPLAALREQPTASLLVLLLAASAAIGLIPEAVPRSRWLGSAMAASVILAAASNLFYQLGVA